MASLSTKAVKAALKMNTIQASPTAVALAALSSADDASIYKASTNTYGILIPFEGAKNRRLLVKIDNTAESGAAVYVEPGTSEVSAPKARVQLTTTATLAASSTVYVVLETGKYGHLEGKYKGNIVLTGAAATVKASYFLLP